MEAGLLLEAGPRASILPALRSRAPWCGRSGPQLLDATLLRGGPSGVATASAQPLPLFLLPLLASLLALSPRRSSHSPPQPRCFFPLSFLLETRDSEGGEATGLQRRERAGWLTKCCFDTSLGWKLSENKTTQNKTLRSVAATEKETRGERKPRGQANGCFAARWQVCGTLSRN